MAPEWALRLTPEPFRDFLPYTPLSALQVIHGGQVLQRALGIAGNYASDTARRRAAHALEASLRAAGLAIQVAASPVTPLDTGALSAETRAMIGTRVLELYFHQIHRRSPWFLDLRPRHFAWNDARHSLTFFPSALWHAPDRDFRQRVQSLYAGFYRQSPAVLAQGIELYSWGSRPLPGFSQRIEQLLREHFGASDGRATRFSVAHFRSTFECIFREMSDSRAKLHPDLTFLGVGLVGLYLTLEQLAVPLDPRRAFLASALRVEAEAT